MTSRTLKSNSAINKKLKKKLKENPIDKTLAKSSPIIPFKSPVNIFESMIPYEEETVERIITDMIDPENVEMKTRVGVPLNLSRLELFGTWYEMENLPKSAEVIKVFCKLLRVNEVSLDGKSREEIVRILSEAMKQERTLRDKLTSPPPE